MPLPLIRYPLDPTGLDPNNAVANEIKTLNSRPVRATVPQYSPFFTESLVVYDNTNNRLLTRGVDYQCVELLQEATARYGKEIASVILIINTDVGSEIRFSYQVLGGLHQFDVSGLINLYETVMLDNRTVDWINVQQKPYEYPPTLHNHLVSDLYGFEFLVVALERIRNAIINSDIPTYEALIAWVKSKTLEVATNEEIINSVPANKIVTLEKLIYALDQYNFNSITVTPSAALVRNNSKLTVKVSSTNLPDNTILYWAIEHIDTDAADFTTTANSFTMTGNAGKFNIIMSNTTLAEPGETFRIVIRKNSADGPIMTKSAIITVAASSGGGTMMDYLNACCLYSPGITINPVSLYVIEGH